jgi:mono/diheme cytochrome c family protein
MTNRFIALCASGLTVFGSSSFGGWAVVTVDNLPNHGVVGQPLRLDFMIRQHGVTPLAGLTPRVEVRSGTTESVEVATPGSGQGRYGATMRLTKAGEWTVTIHSGFGNSRLTLLPFRVVETGTAPPRLTDVERGQRLFVAKGCVSCHVHREVKTTAIADIGPELTFKRYQSGYLTQYLANPAIGTGSRRPATMPNLGLGSEEIAALVAFINTEKQVSSGH